MNEQEYQQQLRQNRIERLQALNLKKSIFGRNLPAEDLVEIASLQKELGLTELAIASPISAHFADELGSSGQFQVLTQMIDGLTERTNDIAAYLGERITSVESTSEEWRHAERKARQDGQITYRTIFLVVGGILTLVVLALIGLGIIVISRFAGQIT